MNINRVVSRTVACALIAASLTSGAACATTEPPVSKAPTFSPDQLPVEVTPSDSDGTPYWEQYSTDTPVDMNVAIGDDLGVSGWVRPSEELLAQQFIGVAPLGNACMIGVSNSSVSNRLYPESPRYEVMVQSKVGEMIHHLDVDLTVVQLRTIVTEFADACS